MKLRHIVTPELNEYLLKTGIRAQFMNNVKPAVWRYTVRIPGINGAFVWGDTPEGTDYWWAICKEYDRETETHSDT